MAVRDSLPAMSITIKVDKTFKASEQDLREQWREVCQLCGADSLGAKIMDIGEFGGVRFSFEIGQTTQIGELLRQIRGRVKGVNGEAVVAVI